MRSDYGKQMIADLAKRIKASGYRVFIAESGIHGFYTDQEGSRVISFSFDLGHVTASGNYATDNPKSTGTGWRVADSVKEDCDFRKMFDSYPPAWTGGSAKWSHTTLDKHLNRYQASSRYQEI